MFEELTAGESSAIRKLTVRRNPQQDALTIQFDMP